MRDGILYVIDIIRDGAVVDRLEVHNSTPQQAVDYLVGAGVAGEGQVTDWRIGLVGAPFVDSISLRAADIGSSLVELQSYSELTRPRFVGVRVANEYANDASKAAFTITADCSMHGSFVVSSSQKGSATGVLLSVASYPTPRSLLAGDVVSVKALFAIDPKA